MRVSAVRLPFSSGALPADPPLLDDADGCRNAGSPEQLALLRRQLHAELLSESSLLRGDVDRGRAAAVLHRWTSACAYCGATRLRERVERWRSDLRRNLPNPRPGDFDRVLAATCAAIEDRLGTHR